MKKLLIIALILSLTGCKSENKGNYTPKEETSKIEQIYEPKEIVKEIYGYMNKQEFGEYELIFDDEIVVSVNKGYDTYDPLLEFDYKINTSQHETAHLTGEFRYEQNNTTTIIKLNEIDIGYYYQENSNYFFHIVVVENEIRYWLYSPNGKATLTINKIWRFVPNGD